MRHGEELCELGRGGFVTIPWGAYPLCCAPRTDTVYLMSQELSRLPTASLAEPLSLPSNLVSLFCRYLDKQTVYHLAAKMTE